MNEPSQQTVDASKKRTSSQADLDQHEATSSKDRAMSAVEDVYQAGYRLGYEAAYQTGYQSGYEATRWAVIGILHPAEDAPSFSSTSIAPVSAPACNIELSTIASIKAGDGLTSRDRKSKTTPNSQLGATISSTAERTTPSSTETHASSPTIFDETKGCLLWRGASSDNDYPFITLGRSSIGPSFPEAIEVSIPLRELVIQKYGSEMEKMRLKWERKDYRVTNLCHEKACLNRTHIVVEPMMRIAYRNYCLRMRKCSCNFTPRCIFKESDAVKDVHGVMEEVLRDDQLMHPIIEHWCSRRKKDRTA